ncbi:Putative signal peptide peptidase SppA [Gemmata sp. SH-PL17]|uniref:S49 family peptidase n=1 Tax=Gemmata sp. SH-PL17 TaxID=1630693 RepID=UPI00078EA4E0|nr:S49 family peptidase [Gemmata sp. SH-PL17]AMV30069.1 Putative signal peptide peptidase SppA [Gemmata sp. SH-PL17]
MKRSYPHVLAAFYGSPWAIIPSKLQEIEAVLWRRVAGGAQKAESLAFDDSDFEPSSSQEKKPYKLQGAAAIIPVHGTITPRPSVFASWSGGASAEGVGRAVEQAAADPQAEAIVLDIDSPGGSVFGMPEAAAKILAARKSKPIYAVANHVAASAAYWIATQAHTIAVTPAGQVGSVGVVWAHTDVSAFDEKLGYKTTYITAGTYKAEGAAEYPLTPGARDEMQRVVNEYYAMFVGAVAKGRGVKADRVERDFGQGRMRLAAEAVELKMADRVATLEQVVNEINAARTAKTKRKVAADLVANGLPTA